MTEDYDYDRDPAAGDDIKDVEPDDIDQNQAEEDLDRAIEEAQAEEEAKQVKTFMDTQGAKAVGLNNLDPDASPLEFDIRASYASIINSLLKLEDFAQQLDTPKPNRPGVANRVTLACDKTAEACQLAVEAARYVQEVTSRV